MIFCKELVNTGSCIKSKELRLFFESLAIGSQHFKKRQICVMIINLLYLYFQHLVRYFKKSKILFNQTLNCGCIQIKPSFIGLYPSCYIFIDTKRPSD